MDYNVIRRARGEAVRETYGTPLSLLPGKKNLDKLRGCLIGGAAGDALGYPVEFLSESILFSKYGNRGIQEYKLKNGLARVSDDTQMTLFTATGLLCAAAHGNMDDSCKYIAKAYRDWYKTQVETYENCNRKFITSWLMNVPEIFSERAPGNTCLSAIMQGCPGTVEHSCNESKGCGGVMRVAPIGLYFEDPDMPVLSVDLLGADAAALTHGHEMGYIPAAMLVHIVYLVSHNDNITLKDAVLDSITAMEKLFPDAQELPGFLNLIRYAVKMAEAGRHDILVIHELGAGWCGDEALAVAIYCALKYSNNFDRAICAAVNHGGDSDSTGAITGNILGAYLGLSGIPDKYTNNLELMDVITELADDLYYGCPVCGESPAEKNWVRKYVDIEYPRPHD